MKRIKRLIWGILFLFLITVVVSVETDFFINIEQYIPGVENYPAVLEVADNINKMTENIPTVSQIIEMVKDKSLPVDPNAFAEGCVDSASPMLNFYSEETLGITVVDNELCVFGVVNDESMKNILIILNDSEGEEIKRDSTAVSTSSYEFRKDIKLPKDGDILTVNVYTGEKSHGEFSSWAIDYVRLENTDYGWEIQESLVSEHNKLMYEQPKSISAALKKTGEIRPDNSIIKSIATQLTEGVEEDYDKLFAIHEWVCGYLYYNIDYVNSTNIAPYVDTDVFESRDVDCLGYSNLFASLCRSVGIPCYVVSGYALGVDASEMCWDDTNYMTEEPNHAWNEAYVDGRWVIVDTTWDSFNRYENGERIKSEKNSRLYFDANPEAFSQNHKIIEYLTN